VTSDFASSPKACEFYYGIVAVIVDHHQTSLPLLINRINYFRHANMALRMKLDFVIYLIIIKLWRNVFMNFSRTIRPDMQVRTNSSMVTHIERVENKKS